MASAKMAFCKASELVQLEHAELMQRLQELDRALDALICHAEVYADLSSSAEVAREGRWLAKWLPGHFFREEEGALASVARMGPELAAFAREMKHQHQEINGRIQIFCKAADELERAEDLQQSICDLKEAGKKLTSVMAVHMSAEERKFAAIR